MSEQRAIEIKQLGLVDYQEAVAIQESHYKAVVLHKQQNRSLQQGTPPLLPIKSYLLFCQHPPVYTVGKSGSMDHLLVDTFTLQQQSMALYTVNRGGAITYHGPGQLVVYPIIDLESFCPDIHRYLRLLEEAIIDTLSYFDIPSTRLSGLTGVWLKADRTRQLPDRKICAIGIRVSKWVTMHGLALNVSNDLAPFRQIVPCGIPKQVTSMQQELNQAIAVMAVADVLQQSILRKLSYI